MVDSDYYEIYKKTGTLAPLQNQREYTEDEKIVLLHFFTNIDKNVYCATDALSSQLWAYLMGQYSRTHISLRDRFLQLFLDGEKALENKKITKDEFVSLKDLAKAIKEGQFKTISYFNNRASSFLKKWGVDYGHNSLKDADRIRFAIEGVSQVFTKVIEAPFPALGDFQEKSTRYIPFGKESIILPPSLLNSKYGEKIKTVSYRLMELYEDSLEEIKSALVKNNIILKSDFERESAFENTINAKAFDTLRYLLPTGCATSLGASFSARILEYHLSEMLSHENEEVRLVAKTMYDEAYKISPGLLSHVEENTYIQTKRERSFKLINQIFTKKQLSPIIKGIENDKRVKLISAPNIDNFVIASIFFEYGRKKGLSFDECFQKAQFLTTAEKEGAIFSEAFDFLKEQIIASELETRGRFDRMPRTFQHGSIIFEFLVDFGAYRDIQRHRASPQLWQGASAIHGYDYPEFIDLPELHKFKEDYDQIMTEISELAREVIEDQPYMVEYVSALGHLVRTTFEMHPGQLAYVLELRTTPQGHQSYRRIFQQVYKLMKENAPIFMKYVKINQDLEATRKKQEEAAAKKREELEK